MSEPLQLQLPGATTTPEGAEPVAAVAGALPPTPEQAAAIDARDCDVFLEAGAGTGKTRVLVDRYCDAVDLDGIEPERILAFTFTEMAAGEMRSRVRAELLRRAGQVAEPERAQRLQRAARAGEGAPITTIHGFCRSMLAAHPVAAGLDPGFRVLDADEAARLAAQAFRSALERLAAEDGAVARLAAGYRNRLAPLVRSAFEECRNHGRLRPELPPLQISALEGPAADEDAALAELQAGYGALRHLVTAFGEDYEALKAARSGADFDDLQLLALELLRRNAVVATAYRERFDHILVDEFQDTSPLQVELVRGLQGPGTRLFVVGDEFQSIYAFRGADLNGFRRRREEALADERAQVLRVGGSFRSRPDVVAAVNAVGSALLAGFEPLTVGRLPEEPAPGPPGPAVELLLTAKEGWNDEGIGLETTVVESAPSRIAEARRLAGRLRELADAGTPPSSMVLLLRAFTHVEAYAEALELAGLDPHVVGGRGYWSAQQVSDALNLLACIANPLEDEALLGALASPACAAGPDALWMLRQAAGRGRHLWPALRELAQDTEADGVAEAGSAEEAEVLQRQRQWTLRLPEIDRERLTAFAQRLDALRQAAFRLPLETLVERVLEDFGLDVAALALAGGPGRLANLRKLARLAAEFEEHEGRDLRGFLAYAAERSTGAGREPEATGVASDHDGVRVMTIHAAKGLEFDTVAVADLGRGHVHSGSRAELRLQLGAEEDSLAPRVGLRLARAGAAPLTAAGFDRLGNEAAEAEAEESARLVYVAASRARRRLVLSGLCAESDFDPGREAKVGDSTLARLLPALGADRSGGTIELPAPRLREGLEMPAPGAQPMRLTLLEASPEAALALSFDRRVPRPPPAGNGRGPLPMPALLERPAAASRTLSYGALAAYTRCGYRFLTERVLGLGTEGLTPLSAGGGDGARGGSLSAAGLGRSVHVLLEASSRRGWREPSPGEIAAAIRAEGAEPSNDAVGAVTSMVAAWLRSEMLDELRGPGTVVRPEVPFRLALGADSVIRGTIDLLCEAPGRPPLVVDYKTDAAPPAPGAGLPATYEIQRLVYTSALAKATGATEIESAYVFLRDPGRPFRSLLGPEQIAAGQRRLQGLVERIRSGSFEVTDSPHAGLCHDCPARLRLCPHPPERTLASAA